MALYKHSLGQCGEYSHQGEIQEYFMLQKCCKKYHPNHFCQKGGRFDTSVTVNDKLPGQGSDLFKVRFTRIVECHLCVDISWDQFWADIKNIVKFFIDMGLSMMKGSTVKSCFCTVPCSMIICENSVVINLMQIISGIPPWLGRMFLRELAGSELCWQTLNSWQWLAPASLWSCLIRLSADTGVRFLRRLCYSCYSYAISRAERRTEHEHW